MYKICFYVPPTHIEPVKNALFNAGAGKIGNYSCCSWQTLGEGQFMPLENSEAFIGEINQLETVSEYKIEMVCEAAHIVNAIEALKKFHPYDEPAYHVFRIEAF
jgi:structural hemagglutinin/hemolysin toxin protein RtxA